MKTNLFLFVLSLVFTSCIAQEKFDPKSTPVAKIEGDAIVLTVEEEIIANSVKAANDDVMNVLNIRVEKTNEFSYLLFETVTESKTIPYAIRLVPIKSGSPKLLATGTTHSCTGHCCESCTFTKTGSGEITGCWCQRAAITPGCQTEARCDHSLSMSSGGILE